MTDENLKRISNINKKISNLIINILFILIIVIVAIVAVQKIYYKEENPSVFGFEILQVMSGSMSGEFEVGEAILIRKINNENNLKIGDIITYKDGDDFVTHRIVDITETDGKFQYTLKGDANNTVDTKNITFEKIEGKYIFKITWMGKIVDTINTPVGMTILVAIPIILLLFFVYRDKKKEMKKNMRREKRLKHELEVQRRNEEKAV